MLETLRFLGSISRGKLQNVTSLLPQPIHTLTEGLKLAVKQKKYEIAVLLVDEGADVKELDAIWKFSSEIYLNPEKTTRFFNLAMDKMNLSKEEKVQRLLSIEDNERYVTAKIKEMDVWHLVEPNLTYASFSVVVFLIQSEKISSSVGWNTLREKKLQYHELSDLAMVWVQYPLPNDMKDDFKKKYAVVYYQMDPEAELWDMLENDECDEESLRGLIEKFRDNWSEIICDASEDLVGRLIDLFSLSSEQIQELFVLSFSKNDIALSLLERGAHWNQEAIDSFICYSGFDIMNSSQRKDHIAKFIPSLKSASNLEQLLINCKNVALAGEIALDL
jgi:hypothetical protein